MSAEESEEAEEPAASLTLAPAMRRAEVFDALAILVALLLLVAVHVGGIGWARLLLTLSFTVFVPGRAIVSNWPRMSRWAPEAMSIVFSLGILTFLATVTLWVRDWHPIALFEVEAALSVIGLVISIVRRRTQDAGSRILRILNKTPADGSVMGRIANHLAGLAQGHIFQRNRRTTAR